MSTLHPFTVTDAGRGVLAVPTFSPPPRSVSMSQPSSSASRGTPDITLHIWPQYENTLSFDVSSVAALLYTQLTIPGRFAVAYTANPDSAPSGRSVTIGVYQTQPAN